MSIALQSLSPGVDRTTTLTTTVSLGDMTVQIPVQTSGGTAFSSALFRVILAVDFQMSGASITLTAV